MSVGRTLALATGVAGVGLLGYAAWKYMSENDDVPEKTVCVNDTRVCGDDNYFYDCVDNEWVKTDIVCEGVEDLPYCPECHSICGTKYFFTTQEKLNAHRIECHHDLLVSLLGPFSRSFTTLTGPFSWCSPGAYRVRYVLCNAYYFGSIRGRVVQSLSATGTKRYITILYKDIYGVWREGGSQYTGGDASFIFNITDVCTELEFKASYTAFGSRTVRSSLFHSGRIVELYLNLEEARVHDKTRKAKTCTDDYVGWWLIECGD